METLRGFVSVVHSETAVVIVGRQRGNSSIWHLLFNELIVICSLDYFEISCLFKITAEFESWTFLKFVELMASVLSLLLLIFFTAYLFEAGSTRSRDFELIFA